MKTRTLKNILFLLIAIVMILARSASAQNVLTIQGNVSDVNGSPIVNHIVTITGNTPVLSTFTYTDSLGDYLALLTVLNMQGALTVSIADCNGLVLTNSHFWSPQITTIISNFVYCASSTPCTLSATVTYDSITNLLTPVVNAGTPPYTFIFNGGFVGPPFYYTPGWCLYIVDANGCDTTICDTSNVLWPCAIPNLTVDLDSNTNVLEVNQNSSNFTYLWTNGDTTHHTQYYPNWCVYVVDLNGCDTTICEGINMPCTLFGAYVNLTSNGLQAGAMTMPPYALTYIWSNGMNGSWSAFYQNWCVQIIDTVTGCDTTICDSSFTSQSCTDSSLINPNAFCPQVYLPVCGCDSVNYMNDCYAINYGGVTSWTQGPCGTNPPPPCQSLFIAHPDSSNPNGVWFYDFSTPMGTINSWLWDFGDNSTSTLQNPQHTYNGTGTYYVCLTITSQASPNGVVCTSTFCDSVWLGGAGMPCHASFQSTQVNASDSTHFFNFSFGTTSSTTYFWDFGDGSTSTDENPIHLYASSGYYTVCLTITDTITNCHDTECHTIFVSIGATQPCTLMGVSVMLDSTTMLMEATWDSNYAYQWTNGATTQHSNYYPQWCVHIIDVTTGCDTVICEYTNPQPCHAMFYFSPANVPNTFEFYDYSSPNPTSWLWDFGDGTTSVLQNPVHTYQNVSSGFYLVCLTITTISPNGNMCTSTYCDSIYLQNMNNCHANFYYTDLGNNTAQFTNTSMPMMPPPGHIIEFDLDYGDGTIDYNIGTSTTHTYPSSGMYYACLTMWVADSSGTIICTDTFCHSVTVTSGPIPCHADFTYYRDSIVINNPNGTTFVGLGNIFYFIDLSMPIGIIFTWSWDMGDFGAGTYHQGTSSSSQFPVYEYDTSGTYYACLTITILIGGNTCSSTYCDTIIAYPSPPPTGIIAQNFIKEVIIYPNPANDKLAIDMQITESGTIQINFINMMGQKLSQQKVSTFGGQLKLITDISHLPNGVYTIEFVVKNSKLHKRVIITR